MNDMLVQLAGKRVCEGGPGFESQVQHFIFLTLSTTDSVHVRYASPACASRSSPLDLD